MIEGDPTGADDEITDLRLMRKSGRYKGAYRNLYTEIGDLVRLRARQRTPVYASLQGSLQRDPNNFQHLEHRDCSIRVCTNREYESQRIRVNGRRSWKDFNETNADHAVAQNTLGLPHTAASSHRDGGDSEACLPNFVDRGAMDSDWFGSRLSAG